jgi:UDP-glucose 4-epimerase
VRWLPFCEPRGTAYEREDEGPRETTVRVLVTGGAGYIGSVTTAELVRRGHSVRVLDDLSTGHRESVVEGAEFFEGRVQDESALSAALGDGVEAVIHFASLSLVAHSVQDPLHYFRENLSSALGLLEGMRRAEVGKLVFSSSAAVYGEPDCEIIDEETALAPVNPYGHTKAMIERFLREQARATGLAAIALRYFNACGADGPRGEDHEPETHLIPRLCLHLLGRLDEFQVFGSDFPTADGTPVRDYVHVKDLASAHVAALDALGAPGLLPINVGTGEGASVLEVLQAASEVTGQRLDAPQGARRAGDPPRLVASRERAAQRLGWTPAYSELGTILRDAYQWHRDHPGGY